MVSIMSKKINIPKDFLYQEYIINQKSIATIAKEIGCGETTIGRKFKIYNIDSKYPLKNYSNILTKQFLYKEYIINKKSTIQIAKEVGCTPQTVLNYLKIFNIESRTSTETRLGKTRFGNILTKAFLVKEYIINKRTIVSIALQIGCSDITIYRNLIKYNIPIRTPREVQILVGHTGKNNNFYGVHITGKNHYNWKGGISFEPYPVEWTKILKEQIRTRDYHVCQICGKTTEENGRKLDVHHIDYIKANLDTLNLIALCIKCHRKTNHNRDYWQIYLENKIINFNKV